MSYGPRRFNGWERDRWGCDGDDDPSEPGDHESGPDSEYYAPAESADACIVDGALPVPEGRLPASVGGLEERGLAKAPSLP